MSGSDAQPGFTEIPASWTDPASAEPYTNTEWLSLNDAIHDHDEVLSLVGMRWVAADALIDLSVIAEDPAVPERWRAFAARGLRKARQRIERARLREEPI